MTERELKRLGRSDLLEMLLSLSQENDSLRQQLAEAQEALNHRMIAIDNSESLAEATLKLNDVFAAAQAACDQYTQNIKWRSERQNQIFLQIEAETKQKCERMLAEAKQQAESYKEEVLKDIQKQSATYLWLRDLLSTTPEETTQDETT